MIAIIPMSNIIIRDGMAKESKVWKIPMLLFFALSALFPFTLIWRSIEPIDFILGELMVILIGCYFLYEFLYSLKYEIVVTNDKLVLKTLFSEKTINLKDVTAYSYKRYKKTQFYQFLIFCQDDSIRVNTRFKNDLEEVLKEITT